MVGRGVFGQLRCVDLELILMGALHQINYPQHPVETPANNKDL